MFVKFGMDVKIVVVGLLYDILDVMLSMKEDLRKRFLDEVVALVEDVIRVYRVFKFYWVLGCVLDFNECV